jgi:hypothetical protein
MQPANKAPQTAKTAPFVRAADRRCKKVSIRKGFLILRVGLVDGEMWMKWWIAERATTGSE